MLQVHPAPPPDEDDDVSATHAPSTHISPDAQQSVPHATGALEGQLHVPSELQVEPARQQSETELGTMLPATGPAQGVSPAGQVAHMLAPATAKLPAGQQRPSEPTGALDGQPQGNDGSPLHEAPDGQQATPLPGHACGMSDGQLSQVA
jgi:hypothetical protein